MSGPRWPDIDPGDLDENGEPYEGYSSPSLDTSFHDHEMGRDRDVGPYLGRCPCGGLWVCTGAAYGGDDESYHGEGRLYCDTCGGDGDA
jgi:hypothetical protein